MDTLQIITVITCTAPLAILLFAFLRTEAARRGKTGMARRIFTGGLYLSVISFFGGLIVMVSGAWPELGISREDGLTLLWACGLLIGLPVLFLTVLFWWVKSAEKYRGVRIAGKILISAIVVAVFVFGTVAAFRIYFVPAMADRKVAAERRAIQTGLRDACSGTGVGSAAAYDPKQAGVHPIVILDEGGKPHEWSGLLPADWYPSSVAEAELVVCLDDEQQTVVEKCIYVDEFWGTGERVPRLRYSRSFLVILAQTGEKLYSDTLTGSAPPVCPPRMEGQTGTFKVSGTKPAYPDLETLLNPFVITTEE